MRSGTRTWNRKEDTMAKSNLRRAMRNVSVATIFVLFLGLVSMVSAATPQTPSQPAAKPPDTSHQPPPKCDGCPGSIAIGQTTDQVIASLGQPQMIAKLGVKTIFYYKDMKVTFTNGIVSKIE